MIDAQAGVVFPMLAKVIPESVDRLFREKMPNGIDPALREEALVSLADFGLKERVFAPGTGIVDIKVGGDDVVIADQRDGFFGFDESGGVRVEAIGPGEFVIE